MSEERIEETSTPTEAVAQGFSWRRLFALAAIGAGLVITFASIFIFKSADPPFMIMLVLFLVGGFLSFRPGKAGVTGIVLASIAGAMFSFMGGMFAMSVIGYPESATDFIPVLSALSLSLTVLISAIALAIKGKGRGHEPSGAAKGLGALLAILLVVILGYSGYASTTVESADALEGDVLVVTHDFEFAPETVSADEGTITVHVTNKDSALHTFTIDELDVDLSIPGGTGARVTFEADAGEYRFYCKPHGPDMDGKIEVS